MSSRFIIGSGFHNKPGQTFDQFHRIWWDNMTEHTKPLPEKVVIMASGTGKRPELKLGTWIEFDGDLGHVHDLNNHRKPYDWCGWSISFISLALMAYFDEADFVYREQDVLAFGPYIDRMYSEIGKAGMIFGSAKCMPAVQSLVLCKHWFIPEFVRIFLGTGSEQIKSNEGEIKFMRMEQENPGRFARYSFGYDRDRPFNPNDEVFYLQHCTTDDLKRLVQVKRLPDWTPIVNNYWAA